MGDIKKRTLGFSNGLPKDEVADDFAPWFDPTHPLNRVDGPRISAQATRRVSIDELERLLQSDDERPIEILPNGEIRQVGTGERTTRKPLTMRENLGGEYADPYRYGYPYPDYGWSILLAA